MCGLVVDGFRRGVSASVFSAVALIVDAVLREVSDSVASPACAGGCRCPEFAAQASPSPRASPGRMTVTLINNKRQQHAAYATIASADKRHLHADQGDAGSCHWHW